MPTLVLATGFELGTTAGWATGNAGNKYVDAVTGSPTFVTGGDQRSGTYCLQMSGTAATNIDWDTNTLGTSKTVLVGSFYVKFKTALPTVLTRLAQPENPAGADAQINFNPTGNVIEAICGGGTTRTGPTVVADTWYRIEFRYDVSAATHTLDWKVDGADQTQASGTVSASTINFFTLGWGSALGSSVTVQFDDVVLSTTSGDYPLGSHTVRALGVDTAAAFTVSGNTANFNTFTNNGTLAAWNATTARNNVDERPPEISLSADGWVQITTAATDYVEMPMETYTLQTGESVSGARMLVPGWATSTTAATIGFRSWNGTTETTLFATADPNFDNSTTAPAWVCKMLTLADINTQTELDALAIRAGLSDDAAPDIGIHAVYVELAVADATSSTTPTLSDSGTQSETLTIGVTLVDSASGVDALALTVLSSESGAVSDSLKANAALTLAEAGTETEQLQIAATATLSDSAIAGDSLSADAGSVNKTLSDGGTAFDLATQYNGPLTITTGGTYTGNYASTNQATPAITINTTQPVTLDRMQILHRGRGVNDIVTGTNLTIKNCVFTRMLPATATTGDDGRAINLDQPASLIIEHNELNQGNGIVALGGTCSPLRIRFNRCRDVGYSPPTNCCIQFCQISQVTAPDAEIAWNHITNLHGFSQQEDTINLYGSSGSSGHPIWVHHNLCDGAYASDADGTGYTGGGIIGGELDGAWLLIQTNTVVSTTNYGCSISGGHDNTIDSNWVVNEERDQNGALHGPNYGTAYPVWNDGSSVGAVTNISLTNNTAGWLKRIDASTTARADYNFIPEADVNTGNVSLGDPIDGSVEQAARDAWQALRIANNITTGPIFELTESGSGSDTLVVTAAITPAELASAAEQVANAALLQLAEAGNGVDTTTTGVPPATSSRLYVNAALPITDSGIEVEAAAPLPHEDKFLVDRGIVAEAFVIPNATDVGNAVDTLAITATALGTDGASATQSLTAPWIILLSDTGVADDGDAGGGEGPQMVPFKLPFESSEVVIEVVKGSSSVS